MIVRELFAKLGVQIDGSSFLKAGAALAGLAAGYKMVKDFAEQTADAARAALNESKITGLTTQQVQELGYAAKQTGVSAEELEHGLVHLARSAVEAGQGSQEAALGYYRLGVRATDANGKVKPMGQLLSEVAAGIAKLPDGTQKAAVAMQIFGRAGAQLIPLLDKGPAGIAELSKQADKLGIVMSDGAIKQGIAYRATLDRLDAAVQGLKFSIGGALIPAFARSATQLMNWISINRKLVALKIREVFDDITRVVRALVETGTALVHLFERIWSAGAAAKTVLIGLGVAVSALAAPWLTLAAAIMLVGEDIELYFSSHGKAKTYTGLLIKGFDLLRQKVSSGWELFKKDPFESIKGWARSFIDWFSEEMAKALASAPIRLIEKKLGIDPDGASITDWLQSLVFGDKPDDPSAAASSLKNPPRVAPVPDASQGLRNLFANAISPALLTSRPLWYPMTPPGLYAPGSPLQSPAPTSGPVTININAPSGNAPDIKKAVQQALDERDAANNSAAHAAVNTQ